MSPDGLSVFTRVLKEEVIAIINGDINSYEKRVMSLLNPAANDTFFEEKKRAA